MLTTFEFIKAWITARTDSERGASLVEYALLLALIAVVAIVALNFLGGSARDTLSNVGESIKTTDGGGAGG